MSYYKYPETLTAHFVSRKTIVLLNGRAVESRQIHFPPLRRVVRNCLEMHGGKLTIMHPDGTRINTDNHRLLWKAVTARLVQPVVELYPSHREKFYKREGYSQPPIFTHRGLQYGVAVHFRPIQGKEDEVAKHFGKEWRKVSE
ncbi:MAG: hypothetical protein Q8R15_02710 [Candidatus Micrarchaeota archaeon]|nr:hypothetical protein [Candidatus Micrarchaeota archaeon]